MMLALLPLVAAAGGALAAPSEAPKPRVAQAQLVDVLTSADSVEAVEVHGREIVFSLVRDGEQLHVVAKTARRGEVISLIVEPAGRATAEIRGLTWMPAELADVKAIVRLVPSEQGGVLMSTNNGRRYLVKPQRLPRTGNEAVEARWGAAWNSPAA